VIKLKRYFEELNVPEEIDALLVSEGWSKFSHHGRPYYSPSGLDKAMGYYTWSEALVYHMYKRLTLS
jgi:hypothetical protein